MENYFTYKNYKGSIEFCKEDNIYFGKVLNTDDLVSYEGNAIKELKADLIDAVNDYIQPDN